MFADQIEVSGVVIAPQVRRIGHLKAEHRMGRNYLWFRQGDANNAILAAVGYNFRRLICWLRLLWRQILSAVLAEPLINPV